MLSPIQLFETPCAADHQAPVSMEFPRPEYWSGLPFPSPGDLPGPVIAPMSSALARGFFIAAPSRSPTAVMIHVKDKAWWMLPVVVLGMHCWLTKQEETQKSRH